MTSIRQISIRQILISFLVFFVLGVAFCSQGHSQAALLMEQPYGFFGAVNPTGHNAIYFERICAETPVRLRRCEPGEMGVVIARYEGIDGYDWIAIPLVPYLYAVDDVASVPTHVDHDLVVRMRDRYREQHLQDLGADLPAGNLFRDGWSQLIGSAYERRIYAFRFATTPAQDDAVMARLNGGKNHSHFNLLFNNCADFARLVLNDYFPHTFKRSIFPDAGMTTPKQITYKLTRYARKHPETALTVYEIPQIPGYRMRSHSNKSVDESIITTVYAIPIAIVNPYLAGGLFVDYLVRGRYHLIPKQHEVLGPENLFALTGQPVPDENLPIEGAQATGAASDGGTITETFQGISSSLTEIDAGHE
jgi:hypothetical protein